jgi:hypothetical protein
MGVCEILGLFEAVRDIRCRTKRYGHSRNIVSAYINLFGGQNPAVLAYDPTGLRSAMSATNGFTFKLSLPLNSSYYFRFVSIAN